MKIRGRVKRSISASLLVVVLAACGDDVDDATQKIQTAKAISDSLLTVTDMPSGWKESQRQVFEKRQNENPSIDPSVWCQAAQTTAAPLVELAGESGADVEMSLSKSGGSGASMLRLQAWSNSNVEEYYSTAAMAAEKCDGATNTDENGAISTTTLITNKSIGDESVSFMQSVEPSKATLGEKFSTISRTTIARFGTVVMVLQLGDAAPTGSVELIDEAAWWGIVTQAGEKLGKITK